MFAKLDSLDKHRRRYAWSRCIPNFKVPMPLRIPNPHATTISCPGLKIDAWPVTKQGDVIALLRLRCSALSKPFRFQTIQARFKYGSRIAINPYRDFRIPFLFAALFV